MRAFSQGSIDTFCAAYAVLNGLQITHGIKPLDGRTLFTKLVLALSKDQTILTKVLTLKTNYIAMTEMFLEISKLSYPLRYSRPFTKKNPTKEEFWGILGNHLDPDNKKTALLQFEKRLPLASEPIFAHWTTAFEIVDDELILFDCSPEPNAITRLNIHNSKFEPSVMVSGEYIRINTQSLILIEAI